MKFPFITPMEANRRGGPIAVHFLGFAHCGILAALFFAIFLAAQAFEARRAAALDAVHESPDPTGCAQGDAP